MNLGLAGLVLGLVPGQVAGAITYRRVFKKLSKRTGQHIIAASGSMLVTTVVATPLFVLFGVPNWLTHDTTNDWRVALFTAFCFGIVQGFLMRDRPQLSRVTAKADDSESAGHH